MIWPHGYRVGWLDEADEIQQDGQFEEWDYDIVVVGYLQ